jgi:hypothetical protein
VCSALPLCNLTSFPSTVGGNTSVVSRNWLYLTTKFITNNITPRLRQLRNAANIKTSNNSTSNTILTAVLYTQTIPIGEHRLIHDTNTPHTARFLAALPQMQWFRWTYFYKREQLFPQRCCQGHGAANAPGREDQRFPAAGSGGFVPRYCLETVGGENGSSDRQCR